MTNKLKKLLSEEQSQRIPLETCYKEDEGLYCFASEEDVAMNSGAQIVYADIDKLVQLDKENPGAFNQEKLKAAKPDQNGLYYVPDLF